MSKEEFLAVAEQRYDALQELNQLDSFYNYEKLFLELWRDPCYCWSPDQQSKSQYKKYVF
ncbi:MAG: hypothetical protein ING84_09575 [Cytophagales bacterium]|nr:hypothetical protein [Cytophagales bacterium]